LSAGTVLSIRLNEAVDAKNSEAGSRFTGSIEQAVMQQGSKGGRTTKMAAGALVGGLMGGGKGELMDSAVGAGAGVAGSAFTGNSDLVVPAESLTSIQAGATVGA
jgi:hypothetical protein